MRFDARTLTHDNRTLPIRWWAAEIGLKPKTIRWRLSRGWSVADALSPSVEQRRITHDGKSLSLYKWARERGVSLSVLRYRLRAGWPIARALDTPACGWGKKRSRREVIAHDGKRYSIERWAVELGLTVEALQWRLIHWPLADALSVQPLERRKKDASPELIERVEKAEIKCAGPKEWRFIEFRGKRLPHGQWAKILGIKPGTLSTRLRAGWSIERALSEPVRKWSKRVNG